MSFNCFRCAKTFLLENEAISHLKKDHFIIDNVSPIKCLIKNCERTYNTIKGLRCHLNNFDHESIQVTRDFSELNIDEVAENVDAMYLVEHDVVIY